MPSRWTRLRAHLDSVARLFGGYTAYTLSREEYIGSVYLPGGARDAYTFLTKNGYEPQYLSAAKRHPETGALHELSMRNVPERHPPATVTDDWMADIAFHYNPSECQYHVHVFEHDGIVEYFSHYELRPDVFGPSFSVGRLREHYRPEYGETYLRGVSDLGL